MTEEEEATSSPTPASTETEGQSTVLVLGGNGRFGRAATLAFAASTSFKWRVLAQVRRSPSKSFPSNVQVVESPLAETAPIADKVAPSASVYIVYAVNPSSYGRWNKEALPLFRQGLDIADKIATQGRRRVTFMFPGNVYNFGENMPPVLEETTEQNPTTSKGQLRCTMEKELQSWSERTAQHHAIVIRAGDFYGCGSGSWFDLALVKDLQTKNTIIYPGPTDVMHAWAYLPDLARTFVAVAELTAAAAAADDDDDENKKSGEQQQVDSSTSHEKGVFETIHFPGHSVTGDEFISTVEKVATELKVSGTSSQEEHKYKHGTMPWTMIKLLGFFNSTYSEIVKMSYLWRVPHQLSGEVLAQKLGGKDKVPDTSFEKAVHEAFLDLGIGTADK